MNENQLSVFDLDLDLGDADIQVLAVGGGLSMQSTLIPPCATCAPCTSTCSSVTM